MKGGTAMDIKILAIKLIQNEVITPLNLFQTKEQDSEAVARQLNKITAKLKAGKRLTAQEKGFLLKHSPTLFETAKKVELQREALKNQLEHARSKEEVNEVIGSALSGVSKKDPDMEYVVAAIQDEAKTFKSSDTYKKLPATSKDANKKDTCYLNKRKQDKDGAVKTGLYNHNGLFAD